MSQIPSNAPLTKKSMHYEFFLIAIAVAIIAGGICWWQIGKLSKESTFNAPLASPTPDAEQREVSNIVSDEQNIDLGDLDAEFLQIDADLNSM